jgi:hypothetical protein
MNHVKEREPNTWFGQDAEADMIEILSTIKSMAL